MKFSKGDIVKFIDELGGGKILEVKDENTVVLLDDNGFDYEVEASRLMLVKPAAQKNTSKHAAEKKKNNYVSGKPQVKSVISAAESDISKIKETGVHRYGQVNIYFAFVPQTKNVLIADLDLYLINDSEYKLYYQIALKKESSFTTIEDGVLEPGMQIKFLSPDKRDLLKVKEFMVRGFVVLPTFIKEGKPFEEVIKVKHVKFTKEGSFKKNDYFDVPAMLIPLKVMHRFVEFAEDNEKHYGDVSSKKVRGVFTSEKVEIDLHIEELEKNYRQLTPDQMINIQIDYFIKNLEKALISEKVKYFVVIHGVGNGRLKTEIRRILREDYPRLKFSDAPFDEYGYGATLVKIR